MRPVFHLACQIFRLGLWLAFGLALTGRSALQPTPKEVEQMAARVTHFATLNIIANRSVDSRMPSAIKAGQQTLVAYLESLGASHDLLLALLKHSDPKVRTLALGALYVHEDPHDLPAIASLVGDTAPAFPLLYDAMNSMGGELPLAEFQGSQTVGAIAQAMVLNYLRVAHMELPGARIQEFPSAAWTLPFHNPAEVQAAFARYWESRRDRTSCASWWMLKMERATRRTTPVQPEYRADIQRILSGMEALPMPERVWTQLYVLAPDGWGRSAEEDVVAGDAQLLALIKRLEPSALLQFLQHQHVSPDPDMPAGKNHPEFTRMSNFILRYADRLLRPEDADALLACQEAERDQSGVNPAWAIGAARVQPARAGMILRAALQRENRDYVTAAGQLARALWQIRGKAELDFLVPWFYQVLTTASEPMHQPETFLRGVQDAARPDTRELMTALMKHPRFEQTDWTTLKEFLKIANAGRSQPLVEVRAIYDAQPRSTGNLKAVLTRWRTLLRREYGLESGTSPVRLSPVPTLITQPAYSVPLTNTTLQMLASPVGKYLALLLDNRPDKVSLWETATGKLLWQMPSVTADWLGFKDDDHLIRFDHDDSGVITEWDITHRKKIRATKLIGKPESGVWDTAPAFDAAARRLGFTGYRDMVCFDTQSGRALWIQAGKSGVRSATALSPDGRWFAGGGGYDAIKTVKIYEAANGQLVRELNEHAGQVGALAFSPDSRFLATATAENGVRLWDLASGKLLREFDYPVKFMGAGLPACRPAFAPNGRWLAIAGAMPEFRIGIFEVETGAMRYEIRHAKKDKNSSSYPYPRPPLALTFASDSQTLYSCSDRLEAWPVPLR